MTGDGIDRGIHVAPGTGIVARIGNLVAYAEGDDEGLNQLVVRLNALAAAPWAEIVRTITSDIAATGYAMHPSLACAAVEHDRVRALVFGDLQLAVVTDSESQLLDATESSTWIDVAVHGSVTRLRCGEQPASSVVGVLRDGVVPGGGLLLDTQLPIPAATRWDRTDEMPTDEPILHVVESPAPSAAVDEINHDEEVAESVDDHRPGDLASLHALVRSRLAEKETEEGDAEAEGASVVPLERGVGTVPSLREATAPREPADSASPVPDTYVVTGERPSLGVFTFDDGAALQLTRPVVIGRGVPERYAIEGEAATTVLLDDTRSLISDVHLEVRLRDRTVELVDKHSENGTFLRIGENRMALVPDEPTVLQPGTTVEVGQRSFTFTVPPPPPDSVA